MDTQKHARIVNAFKDISDDIQSEFQLIRGCLAVLERRIDEISELPKPDLIVPTKTPTRNPYFKNIRKAIDYYSKIDKGYAHLYEIALEYRTSVAELLELGGLSVPNVEKFKRGIFPPQYIIEAILHYEKFFYASHEVLDYLMAARIWPTCSVIHSVVFVAALAQFIGSTKSVDILQLQSKLFNHSEKMTKQSSRYGYIRMIQDIYYGEDNA